MPRLQWLGKKTPHLQRALEGITKGYLYGAEQAEKRKETEKERGLEREKISARREVDLKKIDYAKKRDAAEMLIAAAKNMKPKAAEALFSDPSVKALFKDLGWPIPAGVQEVKTDKEKAMGALEKGTTLPGLTREETAKKAGVYIRPRKITPSDVKGTPETVPERVFGWLPWYETKKEEMEKRRRKQFNQPTDKRRPSISKPKRQSTNPLGLDFNK